MIRLLKTGKFLVLPLKESIGNAIVEYLLNERPISKSDYVFLRFEAPFAPIKSHAACYRILFKATTNAGVEANGRIFGTRITRHSTASRLLRQGVPLPVISEALGHSNPESSMRYITTDDIKRFHCHEEVRGMQDNIKSLRANAESFVIYKKSLGYVYDTHQHYLMNYVTFTEKISTDCCIPDKSSVTAFLDNKVDAPGSLYNCIAVLREFSRYLQSQGLFEAYIVPAKRNPQMHPEPPYFFNHDEIDKVFMESDNVKPHGSFLGREIVLPAMFRLLYCCGLRCRETTTRLYKNVNISEKYIDIIQSKGPKSRRIFISDEISDYLKEYEVTINLVFPDRTYFFQPVLQFGDTRL